jgi:hypothetical protein
MGPAQTAVMSALLSAAAYEAGDPVLGNPGRARYVSAAQLRRSPATSLAGITRNLIQHRTQTVDS